MSEVRSFCCANRGRPRTQLASGPFWIVTLALLVGMCSQAEVGLAETLGSNAVSPGSPYRTDEDEPSAGLRGMGNPPNWGQLRSVSIEELRNNFGEPGMIYAPFCFWFWDEPLDAAAYPDKARAMAQEMLKQGINPGYAHPRVSMADLIGPKFMAPSPSLPKEQWLSADWFNAFDAALQEAESANGYFGYCDEYMWPSGRAAGRVIEKHPELANASLQWDVTDIPGGTAVDLPESFFTVAARLSQEAKASEYNTPLSADTFDLLDLTGVDLFRKASLGQTVAIEHRRLENVSILPACWKGASDAGLTMNARLDGPTGKLIATQHVEGGIRTDNWIALPISEVLPIGTTLYVEIAPDPDFPEQEVGWWSKPGDAYGDGIAFLNGEPVTGDRHLRLSYLTQPDLTRGEWIWQPDTVNAPHTIFLRRAFDLSAGEGVAKAEIRITADNRYALFVNGIHVGQDETWSDLETYDLKGLLSPGRNVIAVEGGGDGGLDALLCDLRVDMAGGGDLRITSDESWIVSKEADAGWESTAFDDTGWQKVRVIGPADSAPWNLAGTRRPYRQATIYSATLRLIGSTEGFTWTSPAEGRWRIYSFQKVVGGDVNVLDEGLASAFFDVSHRPYVDRFGDEMGGRIPGVFCDTEGNYGNGNGLAWSESLVPRYLANTGRDVRLWAPLMLDDDVEGTSARARFDWFEAVSDLYAGYYADVSDSLAAHGMYYIANVWEESLMWQASCVSDHMKVQRAFTMPGTDCLALKGYDVHDFKETQSVSEFESRRLQSEILGAGGWPTFNPVTIKQITNSVIAWGVNHIVPHGVFMTRTLEGNVWVPDWYDKNPMWSNMRLWSDFARRASYVNSQGHVDPDVLLLNPMTSVWALLGQTDKLWWSPEAGNVGLIDQLYSPEVQDINAVYSDAMRQLTSHRVEYLIADRHYVDQMSIDGALLVRGDFRFKTVVMPPMAVMPLAMAQKVVDFARAGGRVYTLGSLPTGSTDNGLHDPAMAALMSELQAQPTVRACPQGLTHELDAKSEGLGSPIEFVSGAFPMLQLRRRVDDRDFFWLVNNSGDPRQCEVAVAEGNGGASVWDCETGEIRLIASTEAGSGSLLQLAFEPHEAYWLVFDPEQPVRSRPIMALPGARVIIPVDGTWRVRIDPDAQPNLEHEVEIPASLTAEAGVEHGLTPWDTWAELPAIFSGLVDYAKTIDIPAFEGNLVLDLGEVHDFAEVWVNGKHLGARLWPPHKFRTDAFRPGSNEIRIRVGNLVNNNYGMASPSGLMGPVAIHATDE